MPISLFTGQPGNGKTLLMMEHLYAQALKAERPIFAGGIDGLKPGLATVLEDPTKWMDCPDGSLIYIDEAWKWFGHLSDARGQQTPAHVLKLAEHRHRGIDFVWTTQMPSQIYPFARGLIADHTHIKRLFGSKMIETYKWSELNEDVKSRSMREISERSTRPLPLARKDDYVSATQHTIKMRLPWKIWAFPAVILAAIALGYFAVQSLRPDAMTTRLTGIEAGPAGLPAGPATRTSDAPQEKKPMTASEWRDALTPTVPGLAFTMPIFAGREAVSQPRIFCSISGGDYQDLLASKCRCLTEQGTKPPGISDGLCRVIALEGVYDPTLAPPAAAAPAVAPIVPAPSLEDLAPAVLSESFDAPRPSIPGAFVQR